MNSSDLLQHQHQDPTSISSMVRDRLSYTPPLHCAPTPGLPGLEFGHLIHMEQQANGGASVVHAYNEELSCLSPDEMQRFAQEFVTLSFSEDEAQAACFVMGIIHGAASYLPDFLDYFSYNFPNAPVKMEVLGKKDIETTTMVNFHSQVSCCGVCFYNVQQHPKVLAHFKLSGCHLSSGLMGRHIVPSAVFHVAVWRLPVWITLLLLLPDSD